MCHCPGKQSKGKKKRTNCLYATAYGHFCPLSSLFSSFSFLFILERKLFGGPGEKIFGPYHLFSFLPTQSNTLQKVFLLVFSPKFSIHPISPPNKHTLTILMGSPPFQNMVFNFQYNKLNFIIKVRIQIFQIFQGILSNKFP